MLRPRIIPCLLIHNSGLVKTVNFKEPRYVGDPINAVKIFNEKEADELMVFDIDVTSKKLEPNYDLIKKLAAECRMPLCYGGGITTVEQAEKIISLGVEKVSICTAAVENPLIVRKLAEIVGKQSVVVVLDVIKKKELFSKGYELSTRNNTRTHKIDPVLFAKEMTDSGAGEIVINYIDNDGIMKGYDIDFSSTIKANLNVPTTFLGGAGSYEHLAELINKCGIVGVAAGSLFVFKGKYKAVLISYPTNDQKDLIFSKLLKSPY